MNAMVPLKSCSAVIVHYDHNVLIIITMYSKHSVPACHSAGPVTSMNALVPVKARRAKVVVLQTIVAQDKFPTVVSGSKVSLFAGAAYTINGS